MYLYILYTVRLSFYNKWKINKLLLYQLTNAKHCKAQNITKKVKELCLSGKK